MAPSYECFNLLWNSLFRVCYFDALKHRFVSFLRIKNKIYSRCCCVWSWRWLGKHFPEIWLWKRQVSLFLCRLHTCCLILSKMFPRVREGFRKLSQCIGIRSVQISAQRKPWRPISATFSKVILKSYLITWSKGKCMIYVLNLSF